MELGPNNISHIVGPAELLLLLKQNVYRDVEILVLF
jgi:hypothetical protein